MIASPTASGFIFSQVNRSQTRIHGLGNRELRIDRRGERVIHGHSGIAFQPLRTKGGVLWIFGVFPRLDQKLDGVDAPKYRPAELRPSRLDVILAGRIRDQKARTMCLCDGLQLVEFPGATGLALGPERFGPRFDITDADGQVGKLV